MVEFLPSLGEGENFIDKSNKPQIARCPRKNKIVTHTSQDTLPHIKRS